MAQSIIARAATLLIALTVGLTATPLGMAQGSLPQLGDGQEMSVAAERALGQRIAREIYRDPDYLDDPVIGEYVQRCSNALPGR
jgi:predicted Zn-dependent protease